MSEKKLTTAEKRIRLPARSIVLNRNQMRKAKEALKALSPERREELRYKGGLAVC